MSSTLGAPSAPHPGAQASPFGVAWILPGVLIAAALGLLVQFFVTGGTGALLTSVAFAVTAVPFAVAALESPRRLLHPLSVLGFTMLLGVAGQTAYLSYLDDGVRGIDPASPFRLLAGLPLTTLGFGLLVTAVGVGALVVGYCWPAARRSSRVGPVMRLAVRRGLAAPSTRRTGYVVVVLCGLATVSFVLYAPKVGIVSLESLLTSQKRFGETDGGLTAYGYYRWGMSMAGVGVVLGTYTMARNRVRLVSFLGGVTCFAFALTVLYSFSVSSRGDLYTVLAISAFTVVAVRRREPRPATVAAVVLVALVGLTVLLGVRLVGQGESYSVGSAVGPSSVLDQAFASRDWMDIAPISVVTARVPDRQEYLYGQSLVSVLWAPVPRSVWPEKPPVRIGPIIGQSLLGFDPDRRSGDPPGLVAEMWLNWGLPAVLLGMGLLGLALRWAERWYRLVPATGGLAALLYGLLVVALALKLPTGDVTGVALFLVQYLLSLVVALWLARGPTSESAARFETG